MSSDNLITYRGNCHCGQVKFTAALRDIRTYPIIRCNCSICTKNGYLLVYPKRENVKFISGEDSLSDYLFATKTKPHRFCRNCGTSILIDFEKADVEALRSIFAVNLRTFVDIEDVMNELQFRDVDGKSKCNPPYQVPF
ncbi:uncharacterized protein K452DRAFT_237096 [Aplosporella prunicola CBS 121167]|uniref:CENP-V/GFA domain-containing protein n=1 Tax=Aplosporella prunicola CBS 121167 TaxID=1176127 RepID=A0A6A6B0A6_9PEZI|nr:uncharacterized protein K452DRAFT_237096 [Aplosporella prunicola CBS 121167]KAF2136674.1 hypothetical protein K452DRAFT_237096 [Aplosporella prunicola CBS 121167]